MRILDMIEDKVLSDVLIMLTPDEAKDLRDSCEHLLANPESHCHVSEKGYQREITVALYTMTDFKDMGFDSRVELLIEQDK